MEKVDQDYLDTILFSSTKNVSAEADEKKSVQEDPMEVYEKIQSDAVKLGTGDHSLDMEIIMKFLQVIILIGSHSIFKMKTLFMRYLMRSMSLVNLTNVE